jgi:hypothetical protein
MRWVRMPEKRADRQSRRALTDLGRAPGRAAFLDTARSGM